MQECVTKQRQTEMEEQGAKRKKTNRDCLRRKREEMRHQLQNDRRDCNGKDMTNVIDCAMKEAKNILHRTRDPANPHMHKAIVCIICDHFIIGTETIHKLTKEDIGAHSERLGVKSYEELPNHTKRKRLRDNTESKVYKICYSHLNQGNTLMVMPPVPSVTPECNHRWHTRKLLLNFPLQMDS
jgi:hypothetical protein